MEKTTRKRTPKEVIKDKYIQIRITQAEKNILHKIVKEKNTTISKYIMQEIIYNNRETNEKID